MMYGLPPFYNKNQTIMFKLIKEGELRFPERPETSKEAKDFISRVLFDCLYLSYSFVIVHKDLEPREIIKSSWPIPGLRILTGNY